MMNQGLQALISLVTIGRDRCEGGLAMPFYEYACKECGKVVELLQKMGTREAGTNCPECGSSQLVKKISVSAPAQVGSSGNTPCGAPQPSAACGGCCQCH